jgi:phosphoribosyl 1,2-cyclic phosphodiesterase
MSLSICVLGSGSAGNCTVATLQSHQRRHLMIDAGLSPRATAARLEPLGLTIDDIGDILLTHLDRDHFHPGWARVVPTLGISVHLHLRHRDLAHHYGFPPAQLQPFRDGVDLGSGARAQGVLLPHDQMGSVGYVLEHDGVRLGLATDLGRDTGALDDHFRNLDALAIESNYDRTMLMASPRPPFLKRRIMGGLGHLSNDQSLAIAQRIAQRSSLSHIVLLHLSRQCNEPGIVRSLYARCAADLLDRLTISSQHTPSPILAVESGRRPQMVLFGEMQD